MSMKKLMVGVAVSALMTGAAFADALPAPTNGAPQEAVVNQIGDDNYAEIDQAYSEEGEALVNQIGMENDALIIQADQGLDAYTAAANTAEINQTGDRALAAILQENDSVNAGGPANSATIDQYSDGDATPGVNLSDTPAEFPAEVNGRYYTNAAGVYQEGEDNAAGITQGKENRAVRGNVAAIGQVGIGNSSSIEQLADGALGLSGQLGENNASDITQRDMSGLYNGGGITPWDPEAIVIQVGEDNMSSVNQVGGDEMSGDLSAYVSQYGAYNDSDISQSASGVGFQGGLLADVEQGGASTSSITQVAEGDQAIGAEAFVVQADGANSTVNQSLLGDGANHARVTVAQDGASSSEINQTVTGVWGSHLDASVAQTGDGHTSLVDQNINETSAGASKMYIDVEQNGSDNASVVSQDFDAAASYNFGVEIRQYGEGNLSNVSQKDDIADEAVSADVNMRAEVTQGGMDNVSFIAQENTEQEAYVEQLGVNGYSEVDQIMIGGYNTAVVFQGENSDTSSSSIRQGGSGAEYASYNYADVEQLGDYSASHIEQVGTLQTAYLTQAEGSAHNASTISQNTLNAGDAANFADVFQSGSYSTSLVAQFGSDNDAFVTQSGAYNASEISQTGQANFADVLQAGDYNSSMVTQVGVGNSAYVTQGGGVMAP